MEKKNEWAHNKAIQLTVKIDKMFPNKLSSFALEGLEGEFEKILDEASRRKEIEVWNEAKALVDRLGREEDCLHVLDEINSRLDSFK